MTYPTPSTPPPYGSPYAGLPPAPSFAPPPPQPQPGTNGFAVASFILGLFGGILLSVIFGIVALVQVRRRPQKGKGLAVAGLALSGAWVLVIALAVVAAIMSEPDRNAAGEITNGGRVTATELKPGDCVNGVRDGASVTSLPAVPCAQPHEGEIFAVFSLPAGEWSSEEAVVERAEAGCQERIGAYEAALTEDPALELMFLHPTAESWRRGDREVTCMVLDSKGTRTGSLRR